MGNWSGYSNIYFNLIKGLAEKLSLPDSLNFKFLDKNIIKRKIIESDKRMDYSQSILRLIKIKIALDNLKDT
jgi:hypothetical protein